MSLHAHEIPEVEEPEHLKVTLRQRILADVDLDAGAAIRQRQEIRLAEAANPQHASAGCRRDAVGLELGPGARPVGPNEVADGRGPVEAVRVRIDPQLAQLRHVGATLIDLFEL